MRGRGGFGCGSADMSTMIYMIQMSMLFAGVATLIQTIGVGPFGARLPIVQGTSFAFLPVMIPIVAGRGAAGGRDAGHRGSGVEERGPRSPQQGRGRPGDLRLGLDVALLRLGVVQRARRRARVPHPGRR